MEEAPVEGAAFAVEQELPREHRHLLHLPFYNTQTPLYYTSIVQKTSLLHRHPRHLPLKSVGTPLYYTYLLHARYFTTPLCHSPVRVQGKNMKAWRKRQLKVLRSPSSRNCPVNTAIFTCLTRRWVSLTSLLHNRYFTTPLYYTAVT